MCVFCYNFSFRCLAIPLKYFPVFMRHFVCHCNDVQCRKFIYSHSCWRQLAHIIRLWLWRNNLHIQSQCNSSGAPRTESLVVKDFCFRCVNNFLLSVSVLIFVHQHLTRCLTWACQWRKSFYVFFFFFFSICEAHRYTAKTKGKLRQKSRLKWMEGNCHLED